MEINSYSVWTALNLHYILNEIYPKSNLQLSYITKTTHKKRFGKFYAQYLYKKIKKNITQFSP